MVSHNNQMKVAAINDFSSFGRCSLAVTIPILSAQKIQCCPVPTAIFTNHTGFRHFSWTDFTPHLDSYISDWKATGLAFDGVMTGFLGSLAQVDFVRRFLDAFRSPETLVIVDPVMGDYGRLYPTYEQRLAEAMRGFLDVADVLTPNLTEACVLAGRPYDPGISDAELEALCAGLSARHASRIVVSGIGRGDTLVNYVYERGRRPEIVSERRVGEDRSGTGDVFSSVLAGLVLRGTGFVEAVRRASAFAAAAVSRAVEMEIPLTDGLPIEELLGLELLQPPALKAKEAER